MQEAADLAGAVQLCTLLLEAPDAEHFMEQEQVVVVPDVKTVCRVEIGPDVCGGGCGWVVYEGSSVEGSPPGRPRSRALSSRRMILPARFFGMLGRKSISFGATAAPRRTRVKPSNSRFRFSLGSYPGFKDTNAFTSSRATGSGLPITPASATAGCSSRTLSTSKGPIKCPDDLITSSARRTTR